MEGDGVVSSAVYMRAIYAALLRGQANIELSSLETGMSLLFRLMVLCQVMNATAKKTYSI